MGCFEWFGGPSLTDEQKIDSAFYKLWKDFTSSAPQVQFSVIEKVVRMLTTEDERSRQIKRELFRCIRPESNIYKHLHHHINFTLDHLHSYDTEMERLRKENDQRSIDISQYTRLIEDFSLNVENLKSDLEECRKERDDYRNAWETLANNDRRFEINELQMQLQQIRFQNQQYLRTIEGLEAQLRSQMGNVQEQLHAQDDRSHVIQNSYESNLKYYLDQNKQLEAQVSSLNETIRTRNLELQGLKNAAEAHSREVALSKQRNSDCEGQIRDLQLEKESYQTMMREHHELLASYEALKGSLKEEQTQTNSTVQYENLLGEYWALNGAHDKLKSEHESLRVSTSKSIHDLEIEVGRKQTAIDGLSQELAVQQRATEELVESQFGHQDQKQEIRQRTITEDFSSVGSRGEEVHQDPYVRRALKEIETIRGEIVLLGEHVQNFHGSNASKTYLHLKEMLIRSVIKLDNVESEGHEAIRSKRKEAIQLAHKWSEMLNGKV